MSPWPQPTEEGALCCICIEWTHIENLSVDPEDGKKWDVCMDCHALECAIRDEDGGKA